MHGGPAAAEFAAMFRPRGQGKEEDGFDSGAPAGSSYCAEGSLALKSDPTLSAGQGALRRKCRRGDTIIVPAAAVGIIASACDLSRPILASGENVFCTLGRIRLIRRVDETPRPLGRKHAREPASKRLRVKADAQPR